MPYKAKKYDEYNLEVWPGFEIVLGGDNENMTILIDQTFKMINYQTVL